MLLIDGYNLLHAAGPIRNFEADRAGLVERIGAYAARRRVLVELVFDGTPSAGLPQSEWVTLRWGRDADGEMIRRIRATRDRTAVTVVTDDRQIRDAAAERKLRVIGSAEFALELDGPAAPTRSPKQEGISPAEADRWMEEFGLGDDVER